MSEELKPEAAPVKPVAWMYCKTRPDGSTIKRALSFRAQWRHNSGWTETPLYAHPPAASTDALVEKVASLTRQLELIRDVNPKLTSVAVLQEIARAALAAMQEGYP